MGGGAGICICERVRNSRNSHIHLNHNPQSKTAGHVALALARQSETLKTPPSPPHVPCYDPRPCAAVLTPYTGTSSADSHTRRGADAHGPCKGCKRCSAAQAACARHPSASNYIVAAAVAPPCALPTERVCVPSARDRVLRRQHRVRWCLGGAARGVRRAAASCVPRHASISWMRGTWS